MSVTVFASKGTFDDPSWRQFAVETCQHQVLDQGIQLGKIGAESDPGFEGGQFRLEISAFSETPGHGVARSFGIDLTFAFDERQYEFARFVEHSFATMWKEIAATDLVGLERGRASEASVMHLVQTTEPLIGEVQRLLHDGAWQDSSGIEQDVADSLESLRREIARPVEGSDSVMIERLSTRLSKYVVQSERSEAEAEAADALGRLEESVIDVMAAMDGTDADVSPALDAVESLAGMMKFDELEKPDDVALAEWDEFLELADENPAAVLHESFEWRTKAAVDATREKYLPLSLGEVGGLSSLVIAGIMAGIPGATLAIGAVVAVVVAAFAANFRRAGRGEERED